MGKSRVLSAVSTSELKRGPWTPQEDKKLFAFIQQYGHGRWRSLPEKAGLQRCGKSCRLRWKNYLSPHIKRGNFSLQEDQTIIQLHALLGNRWSAIAAILPGRTDNEIKNYWNTHLKKRLAKIGFDPDTHKPKTAVLDSANGDPKKLSNLSHLAQWENARLQAEARFARQSKLLNPTPPQELPQSQDFNLRQLRAWETLLMSSTPSPAAAGSGVGGAGAANAVQEVGSFGKFDGLVWSNKQIETPTLTMPSFPEFNEDVEGELLEPLLLQNSYKINTATGTFGVEDVWTLEQCNNMNNINGYDIDQYVRMSEGLANMYFCGYNLPTN